MDSVHCLNQPRETLGPSLSLNSSKGPRLLKNDKKWDSVKHEVQRIYMIGNHTLQETMAEIERIHGIQASSVHFAVILMNI